MLELPESLVLAAQLKSAVASRSIRRAVANASPHRFAFYHGDPADYGALLAGAKIGDSAGLGAMVELLAGNCRLVFGDGANLRYYEDAALAPAKHQLLLELDGGAALVCSIQMYGTVLALPIDADPGAYYRAAKEKPSPLGGAFDRAYFERLFNERTARLPAKAFLATEQRIPGLGNGVLQDILFRAGVHPRRRMNTLSVSQVDTLFDAVKATLAEMTRLGGRDTEKDLFGNAGRYRTLLSRNTVNKPCPVCGAPIEKAAYLGGTVYYCPACQPLERNEN